MYSIGGRLGLSIAPPDGSLTVRRGGLEGRSCVKSPRGLPGLSGGRVIPPGVKVMDRLRLDAGRRFREGPSTGPRAVACERIARGHSGADPRPASEDAARIRRGLKPDRHRRGHRHITGLAPRSAANARAFHDTARGAASCFPVGGGVPRSRRPIGCENRANTLRTVSSVDSQGGLRRNPSSRTVVVQCVSPPRMGRGPLAPSRCRCGCWISGRSQGGGRTRPGGLPRAGVSER